MRLQCRFPVSIFAALITVTLSQPALAIKVTEDLDVGGAIRGRLDYDPDRDISKFSFDTFFLTADYHSDTWIAAAKYRFYGDAYPYEYTDKVGDISFAEYAWIGYRFTPQQQVQVGQTAVPFGLAPYFGSTFFETLGNVIDLEDAKDIGIKYIATPDNWNLQLAYYPIPAEQGRGLVVVGALMAQGLPPPISMWRMAATTMKKISLSGESRGNTSSTGKVNWVLHCWPQPWITRIQTATATGLPPRATRRVGLSSTGCTTADDAQQSG